MPKGLKRYYGRRAAKRLLLGAASFAFGSQRVRVLAGGPGAKRESNTGR